MLQVPTCVTRKSGPGPPLPVAPEVKPCWTPSRRGGSDALAEHCLRPMELLRTDDEDGCTTHQLSRR
jgi:hypothetical protein